MDILTILKNQTALALNQLYEVENADIVFEKTNPNFSGDYTFVVFPYLRNSRKKPEDTAAEIGELLKSNVAQLANFNIVKGFLNLELSNDYWITVSEDLCASSVVIPNIGQHRKVVVEYSSPNTNKPLHLGHVRNNVLGFSFSQILKINGFVVVKANLVNDRGIHICKSMLAWQKFGNNETPESSGIKGDHLVGKYYVEFDKAYKTELKQLQDSGLSQEDAESQSKLMAETRLMLQKWEEGDTETMALWNKMNGWVYAGFNSTYNRLGIEFDKTYYESNTYLLGKDLVLEGLLQGAFFKKDDGSVWVDLTDDGLDEKILLRADGTSVYMTQDIGTAQLKYDDFKMDQSIYVVGNEQDYHFKVLSLILKKLGKSHADAVHHLSYGMVDLPEGKMKSREGTVVDADELMEEVVQTAKKQTEELGKTEGMNSEELEELYETLGIGALKYFLLKVDAKKRMLYDPKESIDFQGNTAPFIQYTYTRIASLLRAADKVEYANPISLQPEEKDLIVAMIAYPETVNNAALDYNPSIIANAVYDIAKKFNKFYHEHSILGAKEEHTKNFRIALSKVVGDHIKHGFSMLGIDVPSRM
jgi:arginyl-tRNA synthetase